MIIGNDGKVIVGANSSTTKLDVYGLIKSRDLTALRVLTADANKNIASSDITTTELDSLDNITGNVQDQIDGKQDTITGAATTVVTNDLAASRVVISDASGKISVSGVTSTTLGYLDATSSVQTQLNGKIGGSGTDNYIPRFNGTDAVENSIMYDDGTKIGIGTNAPNNILHVKEGASGATPYTAKGILFESDNQPYLSFLSPDVNSAIINFGCPSDSRMAKITAFFNAGDKYMAFAVGNNHERMRITEAGIGIGTTTPLTDLEVKAPSGSPGRLTISGSNDISAVGQEVASIQLRSGDTSPASDYDIVGKVSMISEYNNGAYAGMAFYTADNTSSPYLNERVRINHIGRVGIGTTAPQVELHVNGVIRSDDLIANTLLASGADKDIVSSTVTTAEATFLDNTLTTTQVLFDGPATNLFEVAVASGEVIGGKFTYTIQAKDAFTEIQVITGEAIFNAVYDTPIVAGIEVINDLTVVTSGTLTTDFTIIAGTGKVTVKCYANSSLTSPTITMKYKLEMHQGTFTEL